MRHTVQSTGGTSFHGTTIFASVNDLIGILGEPRYVDNSGTDKTTHEWEMETDDGDVFTVYDWKEYRSIDSDEEIEWHIGGMSEMITTQAKHEIMACKLL